MQASGHAGEYLLEENFELRDQFHAIISLCFVPPDDVPIAFALLHDYCLDELDDVVILLEDHYVLGRRWGRSTRSSRYPLAA